MFIEPGQHTLLQVKLVRIFLNAVPLSGVDHQLRFHSHVSKTGVEFISPANGYASVVDSMYQERRRAAVSDKRNR